MRKLTFLAIALLAACGDKETGGGEGDDTGGGGGDEDRFAEYVYVTEAATGDFTGFEDGYQGSWLSQSVDSSKQITVSMTGKVEDFETGDEVSDARLELWHNNVPSGSPDQTIDSDGSGALSGDWPLCQPVAYRTTTDAALGDTKVTIQVNNVEGFSKDGVDVQFNSVSSATYQVIPSLLGVSPDPTKGVVAGTAYDVNGDAFSGAQIVAVDSSGNIPEGIVVKYFVDEFPNRQQEWTSDDGLFVVINMPVGDWTLQSYISDGAGGHKLVGASGVSVVADSINISSIYSGYGDGVSYPDSCLTAR